MESSTQPVNPHYPHATRSDEDILNDLRLLAAQWFKNSDILLLEELFRRYEKAKADAR